MLSRALTFSPDQDESFFSELPTTAAVFVLRGDGEPYISKTANLRRRLQRLLGVPLEQSKRLNLRDRVREAEFTLTGSEFESQFVLYRILRETFPKTYAKRLRLRPAPLVKLHLENEYPRASVTRRYAQLQQTWGQSPSAVLGPQARSGNATAESSFAQQDRRRLSARSNLYYGPFPSRAAADSFAGEALDFFKMRRCVEDLKPDPSFPGCVYSEMKMCLAPCFKGCTDADYHAEVARVEQFLDTRGASLLREFAEHRERASSELAFEEAAAIHAKVEKLKPLISQLPEIVQRVDQLKALIIQPAANAGHVALFLFADVSLHGPSLFAIEQSGEPKSLESRLQAAVDNFPIMPAQSNPEHTEHLAIMKRWYYRSQRAGEVFFADDSGRWPLRRMVRGIGRVFKGEKAEEFSATQLPASPSEPA